MAYGIAGYGLVLLLHVMILPVWGHHNTQHVPEILQKIGLEQRLNTQIQRALPFRDAAGKAVQLGDYLQDRPVILTLAYFDCPNLCPLVLEGLVKAMRVLGLDLGKDFDVITVSIDPKDTPALATQAKQRYLKRYGNAHAAAGWHFLTGEQEAITRLAQTVGFRYTYDEQQQQYAHASGIMVLTPQGRVSRYFYGVEFPPRDLRLGLVEASRNTIGTPIDQLMLMCYHYDPMTGQYSFIILPSIRLAGLLTVAGLAMLMGTMIRRDRRRKKTEVG
jgi:protein SCO1/2